MEIQEQRNLNDKQEQNESCDKLEKRESNFRQEKNQLKEIENIKDSEERQELKGSKNELGILARQECVTSGDDVRLHPNALATETGINEVHKQNTSHDQTDDIATQRLTQNHQKGLQQRKWSKDISFEEKHDRDRSLESHLPDISSHEFSVGKTTVDLSSDVTFSKSLLQERRKGERSTETLLETNTRSIAVPTLQSSLKGSSRVNINRKTVPGLYAKIQQLAKTRITDNGGKRLTLKSEDSNNKSSSRGILLDSIDLSDISVSSEYQMKGNGNQVIDNSVLFPMDKESAVRKSDQLPISDRDLNTSILSSYFHDQASSCTDLSVSYDAMPVANQDIGKTVIDDNVITSKDCTNKADLGVSSQLLRKSSQSLISTLFPVASGSSESQLRAGFPPLDGEEKAKDKSDQQSTVSISDANLNFGLKKRFRTENPDSIKTELLPDITDPVKSGKSEIEYRPLTQDIEEHRSVDSSEANVQSTGFLGSPRRSSIALTAPNNAQLQSILYGKSFDKDDSLGSRLGQFSSVREVSLTATSQRNTVALKKVAGLKIGFSRDQSKFYRK